MRTLLGYLASLKLTFLLLILLLLAIMIAYNGQLSYPKLLSFPLSLLSANLVAAIISNKAFQQNLPLLLFHLTLLATVILVALSRLTYLDGWVELNEGEEFTGMLDGQTQGIFHHYSLKQGDFTNLAVQLEFTPYVAITKIRSRVLANTDIGVRELVVGEHQPLVVNHYRFYVTRNVGYSALFSWQDKSNAGLVQQTGTLNFPPFLFNEFSQTNTWQPPNSKNELWFMLQPEDDLLAERKPIQLTPPENHYLIIRAGEDRHKLRAGQQLILSDGTLTYHGLRTWMGFKVHYDPYKSYLLACALLTVFCLSWFFWQKFTRKSWLAPTGSV
ncbi:hypothetical protein [Thalassotalea sp. G2M2-11]|uniref:hypothetical protein n=1 Tax=Thalassotalea sp. G2M2-11 TaxID=2787627 RepID=UPI0019D0333B|nr:hypothetical protein [Thalassotalea sp. G2M2-11]